MMHDGGMHGADACRARLSVPPGVDGWHATESPGCCVARAAQTAAHGACVIKTPRMSRSASRARRAFLHTHRPGRAWGPCVPAGCCVLALALALAPAPERQLGPEWRRASTCNRYRASRRPRATHAACAPEVPAPSLCPPLGVSLPPASCASLLLSTRPPSREHSLRLLLLLPPPPHVCARRRVTNHRTLIIAIANHPPPPRRAPSSSRLLRRATSSVCGARMAGPASPTQAEDTLPSRHVQPAAGNAQPPAMDTSIVSAARPSASTSCGAARHPCYPSASALGMSVCERSVCEQDAEARPGPVQCAGSAGSMRGAPSGRSVLCWAASSSLGLFLACPALPCPAAPCRDARWTGWGPVGGQGPARPCDSPARPRAGPGGPLCARAWSAAGSPRGRPPCMHRRLAWTS